MKTTLRALTVLLLAALLVSVTLPTLAQENPGKEMTPDEVVQVIYDAVMAHDLETAEHYLADDIVLVIGPPPPDSTGVFIGKEAVLGWYENLIQNNVMIELSDAEVSGDRVTVTNFTWMDALPVRPAELDGTAIVQDGLVKTMSWVMTPDTVAKLDAAIEKLTDEALVLRWLDHWNTVDGSLEGIEELLTDDFVSHNMPEGDRNVMIADVAAFREDHPNTYFSIDDLVIADGKAFLTTRYWQVPEGAPEGAEGEPSPQFMLVLGFKDGKIAERTLYVPLQE